MPTQRQVKRPNYKEAAGSSEEEDESSRSQQKRRYPTKAKPTSAKSVANTRPRRAASNRRVVQDSSGEELEDDIIELPSSSSEDERPAVTETRTSRRRLQPTRAARQQPKVVDISLSPQEEEEEEEEDTLDEDASEQEASGGEEQPKTARKTHPFFASVRRSQPARAARQSLKGTSSEEEEASIQMNTRMTRRNNPQTTTARKLNAQVQPTRTMRQQQQKQTSKKVPRHVGKNPPRKRPKCDMSSEESSVNDSSSSDESSNDSAIEVELILACRQKARKEWKELGAAQNTSEIDNGSRWKQESDSEDDADSDQEDRFLVKWKDLSYLHCSWEKRDDLVDETINGSELLADFCEDGKSNDENDSSFIDPSFLAIERILESTTGKDSFPIIFEKESELYEKGKGRRFCIKWHNLPECSYEFERDLILKKISYESHLDSIIQGKKNKHTSLPATTGKQKKPPKSPAVQHSTMRCATPTTNCAEIDENNSSDDEDENEPDNEVRIQRIIASRRETRQKWKEICSKMNTTEIDNGSRWFQDDDDNDDCLDEWEERFLVKWAGLSFLHCSWETIVDLKKLVARSSTALRNFQTKCPDGLYYSADERGDGDYFDPSYMEIDRILELGKDYVDCGIILDKNHPKFEQGTGRQFLIKWVNLPYTDISYEFERDLIVNDISYEEHLDLLQKRSSKPSTTALPRGERATRRLYMSMFGEKAKGGEEREKKLKEFQDGICKMEFKNGGKLRDYQAEGVTWMLSNFLECRSMILADEMGLGKTIQTATFINYLATDVGKRGPFLVIAPLSTLPHWKREFDRWTNLNTIVYSGSADDRFTIRRLEFAFEEDRPDKYHPKQKYLAKCHRKNGKGNLKTWMVQVVITTPEYLIADDYSELEALDWEVLVVDEAHRLKNHASKLAVNLRNDGFRFGNILCLTGTPIQNTVHELWALLNFIDKKKFDSLESFSEKFGEIKSKETVNELHELIRPYILRRLKEDVEKSVPPKEETLIEVELTSIQKRYYRALYEKNVQYLYQNKKKLDMPSLSNLAMQLRKVCNSAFLVNGVETEFREQEQNSKQYTNEVDCLLKSSGKLVLLHKLLPKLKQEGHKVLIFSQFKVMLDIIEDYLSLTQFKFERIDGSITGHKRQSAIDRFQAKHEDGKESPLVMLLTTKAGGVGITLTAADVCIIWDSDYNPQNDLQAQARCHRIGQTKSVTVYRLLSRKTYEQQLFHMASLKMGLDTAVLHGVENQKGSSKGKTELTKEEIEKLLRHGAYDIFNEEKAGTGEEESKAFQEANIDEILAQRAKKVVHENTGSHSTAAGGTFSKASFRLSLGGKDSSSAKETEQVDIDDPDFWVKMVGERVERSTPIILKRRRAMPNYRESGVGSQHSSSSSASVDETSSINSDSDDSAESTKITKEPRRWGGELPGEWRKQDVKDIVEILQSFGYSDIPTSVALAKLVSFHGENEVKRMCSSIVLFTLKEAAELESKVLCKRQNENEIASATPDENQDTDVGMQDPNASECRLSRDFSPSKELLEEAFLAIAKQHSLFFSKIMQDIICWTAGRTPRSSNSNSTEENLNISIFSEWNALAQFLIDYAPSQLVYNRSNSRSISLQKTLLDVCSLAFAARQAVLNADTLFRDQSTRKSDDEDLNLALTLNTCKINAFIPSSSWRPRHDGVLVRAIAKHGLPNSVSAYNKLKTDASIKWSHVPSEAESKDYGSLDFALHYTHLSETACEAALILSSADGLFVDVNRVSKLLCLQKENGGWVVNEKALRRFFDFSLPSRTDLVARAKTIFGIDKAVKINHGFTELDQFNPRNILVKEMLLWLINAKISRSTLQDWNIGAGKAIFECNRLAEKYSDDSMLSISEHIQSALNTKDLRKNNRVVKNVLRAILGLEPLIKSKNPSIFPSTNNDRTSTDSFDKQVTEQVPLSNPQDKSQTGVKQSWAEAAIDRCSKLSGLKSGTGHAFDANSKRLSLTATEEQLLKILSSHGIPVWQNGWADLTDSTSKNELTWDWLASKLYSLMKIWLTQSIAICDNAKSSLQGYEKKAELSGSSDDQKKMKLQTRYSTAVSTMEAIKSILPDCELLCSRPADFGRKSVMLLQAVLNTADLNEYKLKGNKAGKVADSLGLGVLKWGRSELKRWAESLDLVDNDTRNPLSAVAIEYMQKQGTQLEVSAKLDKKSCRVIHCQVFQQTRLRSISLSHGTDEFSQMVSKASGELEKGSPWQGRPLEWAAGLDDLKLVDGILNYGYGSFDTLTQPDSGLPKISIDAAQMRLVQLCRELHHLHVSHERMQVAHSSAAFDSSKPIANKQTLIGSFFSSGPSKDKPIRLDNSEKMESEQTRCQLTEPSHEKKHAKVVADNGKALSNNLGRKRSLLENESMIEILSSSDEDDKKRSRYSD